MLRRAWAKGTAHRFKRAATCRGAGAPRHVQTSGGGGRFETYTCGVRDGRSKRHEKHETKSLRRHLS